MLDADKKHRIDDSTIDEAQDRCPTSSNLHPRSWSGCSMPEEALVNLSLLYSDIKSPYINFCITLFIKLFHVRVNKRYKDLLYCIFLVGSGL